MDCTINVTDANNNLRRTYEIRGCGFGVSNAEVSIPHEPEYTARWEFTYPQHDISFRIPEMTISEGTYESAGRNIDFIFRNDSCIDNSGAITLSTTPPTTPRHNDKPSIGFVDFAKIESFLSDFQ